MLLRGELVLGCLWIAIGSHVHERLQYEERSSHTPSTCETEMMPQLSLLGFELSILMAQGLNLNHVIFLRGQL